MNPRFIPPSDKRVRLLIIFFSQDKGSKVDGTRSKIEKDAINQYKDVGKDKDKDIAVPEKKDRSDAELWSQFELGSPEQGTHHRSG